MALGPAPRILGNTVGLFAHIDLATRVGSAREAAYLGGPVAALRGQLEVTRTAVLMRLWSGLDALGVCLYAATPTRPLLLSQVEDLVAAVTGERPRIMVLGALRLWLARQVNQRLGLPLAADVLPDRFFTEPVATGRYAGAVLDRAAFTAAVTELHHQLGFTPGLVAGNVRRADE